MSNTIKIRGNLGRPGQIRQAGSQQVFGFPVADTPRRLNQQTQQWEDAGDTTWYDVSVWGDDSVELAERMEGYRGQVTVNGRVTGVRTYEVNGETRAEVQVSAEAVALHRAPRQQGQSQSRPAPADPWQEQSGAGGWGGQPTVTDEAPF